MKNYVLVYAEVPAEAEASSAYKRIFTFAELAKDIKLPPKIKSVLPKGTVWLFERGTGEQLLGDLFDLAERSGMELRIKYLTED